jgi:hypothetical protein
MKFCLRQEARLTQVTQELSPTKEGLLSHEEWRMGFYLVVDVMVSTKEELRS